MKPQWQRTCWLGWLIVAAVFATHCYGNYSHSDSHSETVASDNRGADNASDNAGDGWNSSVQAMGSLAQHFCAASHSTGTSIPHCSTRGYYAPFEVEKDGERMPLHYWDFDTLHVGPRCSQGCFQDLQGKLHLYPSVHGGGVWQLFSPKTQPCVFGDCSLLDSLHLETVANMDRRLMGSSPKSLSVWVSMPSPLLSPNSLTGWGRCVHTGDSCDHWPITPIVSFGSSFHNGADGVCCAFGAAVHAQLGPGFVGSDCDAWPTTTKAQVLPHDVWHHLAVTYAGGRAPVRVWLNGTVVATRSAGLGPLQTRGPSGVGLARRLTIGADSWWHATTVKAAVLRVDEIKVYDFELSQSAVKQLAQLPYRVVPEPWTLSNIMSLLRSIFLLGGALAIGAAVLLLLINFLVKRPWRRLVTGSKPKPYKPLFANTYSAVYDIVITGGLVHDGTGAKPVLADVAIIDGRVALIGDVKGSGHVMYDATGKIVAPGLVDLHTHYDAEVLAMPGLEESVKHGVTTVIFGNCSLSVACAKTSEDVVNLFSRVENLPKPVMEAMLPSDGFPWSDPASYYEYLDKTLPIGPNVATFIGHSDLRVAAMGLDRAATTHKPEAGELKIMAELLDLALDAGYVGLSIDMLPFHRLAGPGELAGVSVPSQQAGTAEYAALAEIVRRKDGIFQATPNVLKFDTALTLFRLSFGGFFNSKPLRTTVLSALDVKWSRILGRAASLSAWIVNKVLLGNLRFQTLPTQFTVYNDGALTPLFEEFPAGAHAIKFTENERKELYGNAEFRAWFRKDWAAWGTRLFARDFSEMFVVRSPEGPAHEGKSFAQIAREAGSGVKAVDLFMDLIAMHGDKIRWRVAPANDRPDQVRRLLADPHTLPGFTDSGAHTRNMAFHNGGLHFLTHAAQHPEWMPMERAIHRLTQETAEWVGLDAGTLRVGDVADVVVLDPDQLRQPLPPPYECHDRRIGGAMRMLCKSDGRVNMVVIGGRVAMQDGSFVPEFGKEKFGRLLRRSAERQRF